MATVVPCRVFRGTSETEQGQALTAAAAWTTQKTTQRDSVCVKRPEQANPRPPRVDGLGAAVADECLRVTKTWDG